MNFIAKLITARPLITCIVIGVVLMSVWWLKFQKKLNMKWYWAPILSFMVFIIGVIGGKLLAYVEVGFNAELAANRRIWGSILLLIVVIGIVAKLTKRDFAQAYDISAVATLIAGIIVRIACLVEGCCGGIPIMSGGTFRWPLVEMEILLDIVLVIYFWNRVYIGKTNGLAYPIFVLIYGVFRFVIEWFREEYTGKIGIFHLAHIWSLLAIIGATIAIWLIKRHNMILGNKTYSKHKTFKKEVN